jgi:hypothetical protein
MEKKITHTLEEVGASTVALFKGKKCDPEKTAEKESPKALTTLTLEEKEALKNARDTINQERDTRKQSQYESGRSAGFNWAKNPDNYTALSLVITKYFRHGIGEYPPNILTLRNAVLMTEDHKIVRMFGHLRKEEFVGASLDDENSPDFARGFLDGAHDVFEAVESLE